MKKSEVAIIDTGLSKRSGINCSKTITESIKRKQLDTSQSTSSSGKRQRIETYPHGVGVPAIKSPITRKKDDMEVQAVYANFDFVNIPLHELQVQMEKKGRVLKDHCSEMYATPGNRNLNEVGNIGHHSDIWGFGVTMLKSITHLPFRVSICL